MMDSVDVAPPVISQAPVAPAVADGTTLTLAVKASGAGQLAYQWQRDGVSIAGASDSHYTTSKLSASDHRTQYRVLVTNAGGVASSVPVVLHVVAAGPQDRQAAVTSR